MSETNVLNDLSRKKPLEKPAFDVDAITTIRHFEIFLRAAGFSRGRAKMIAVHGWNGRERQQHVPAFLLRTTRSAR